MFSLERIRRTVPAMRAGLRMLLLTTGLGLVAVMLAGAIEYNPVRQAFTIEADHYPQQGLSGRQIRLLSWNIHKEGNEQAWLDDLARIQSEKAPHITLLQEAIAGEAFAQGLQRITGMGWSLAPNITRASDNRHAGVLTAAVAKPLQSRAELSRHLEPVINTPKVVLYTRYRLHDTDEELLVVNIHGINFRWGLQAFRDQIDAIVDHAGRHVGPLIVAGDFNTWNEQRLDYLDSALAGLELRAVPFAAEGEQTTQVFGNPMDHIYYRHTELATVAGSADVMDELVSSDHRALFVAFDVL